MVTRNVYTWFMIMEGTFMPRASFFFFINILALIFFFFSKKIKSSIQRQIEHQSVGRKNIHAVVTVTVSLAICDQRRMSTIAFYHSGVVIAITPCTPFPCLLIPGSFPLFEFMRLYVYSSYIQIKLVTGKPKVFPVCLSCLVFSRSSIYHYSPEHPNPPSCHIRIYSIYVYEYIHT